MSKVASHSKQVLAAIIGNAFEWYDFIVFGYMIAIISRLFFPVGDEYESLMKTMALFGVGFFMRPIGAIILGIYADHKGRKAAMQLIMFLMTLAVAMLAFAPTYAAIGVAAPMMITLARLLQGFSVGGEFASSTAFLVEIAPADKRGLYGSLQSVGQVIAGIFASLAGLLVTGHLSPQQLDAWGWRIPFFIGLLIGPVGMYIRRHLEETSAFKKSAPHQTKTLSLKNVLLYHRRSLLATFFMMASGTMGTYTLSVYLPIYAKTQLGLTLDEAFVALALGGIFSVAFGLLFARLSDHIGRKHILAATLLVSVVTIYPLFAWIVANPTFGNLILMQMILGVISGGWGPYSTAMAEQFPTHVRSTGLAITYNFAVALFGGTSPLIVSWLIHVTGSPMAPAYYLMLGWLVGFVASLFLVERHKDRILY